MSMDSMFNVGSSFPSSHGNFVGRDGLEGMIDNGAHRFTAASGLTESAQIKSHQDRILQRIKELTAAKAKIDAELREIQDLYHKLQHARAQQNAQLPFTTATPTPYVPFTTTPPYSTINTALHSFSQIPGLSGSQDEMWNIPNHMPQPSTSQLSTALHAQPPMPPLPKYTVRNRASKKVFRCECGHEASRGDMRRHRESLEHAKRSYICYCSKSYTRRDSLRRHEVTHA